MNEQITGMFSKLQTLLYCAEKEMPQGPESEHALNLIITAQAVCKDLESIKPEITETY